MLVTAAPDSSWGRACDRLKQNRYHDQNSEVCPLLRAVITVQYLCYTRQRLLQIGSSGLQSAVQITILLAQTSHLAFKCIDATL